MTNPTTVIFESHATSTDNEAGLASGHNDVALSELGVAQAKELGRRRQNEHFDAIFCSDLQRSYRTAELAFGAASSVIKDPRLRECNYGGLTQRPASEVEAQKAAHIHEPFPRGERYADTMVRMRSFLDDLGRDYPGKRVMIIGHRATQYGLEHWLNHVPLAQTVTAPWSWQPGWEYALAQNYPA